MAQINREKDASEQTESHDINLGSIPTGTTKFVWASPFPCILKGIVAASRDTSNAMQLAFERLSSGSSGIPLGISNLVLKNVASVGVQGWSGIAASGATALILSRGDVVQLISSVSNGNAQDLILSLVVQKTQEIVTRFGV